MASINTPTLATFLVFCIPFALSNIQGDANFGQGSQYYPNMDQTGTNYDGLEPDNGPEQSEITNVYRTPSLDDILNTPVSDASQMCSQRYVVMFLVTGDLQHLLNCRRVVQVYGNGNGSSSVTSSGEQRPVGVSTRNAQPDHSYSGRLLKRILQNMGRGTTRIDTAAVAETAGPEARKRSRLSINGPLASLVDMLRQESRRHRRPTYAFHQQLLKMG